MQDQNIPKLKINTFLDQSIVPLNNVQKKWFYKPLGDNIELSTKKKLSQMNLFICAG